MFRRIVVVAGATLLAAPAFAQSPEHTALRAGSEGRAVYLDQCAGCHGVDARGVTKAKTKAAAPDLTLIATRDGSFDFTHIANHISGSKLGDAREMPCFYDHFKRTAAWTDPSDAGVYPFKRPNLYAKGRIDALTAYLELIQPPEGVAAVPR